MTDKKTIDSIKQLIRKQIAELKEGTESAEVEKGPESMSQTIVDLTKAAHASLNALNALKNKAKMPSQKATDAVSSHITALEQILTDMLHTPVSYLDVSPQAVVTQRVADLDRRLDALGPDAGARLADHTVKEQTDAAETAGGTVISDPCSCPTCGGSYDKKLHKACPSCTLAKETNESVKTWAKKLRSTKTSQ